MATLTSPRSSLLLLPEAVAAHCLSFLASVDHARCAQACTQFRLLALVTGGFPDEVCVDSRHIAAASPALARMRPRRLLEIRVASLPRSPGYVRRLLANQARVGRIRVVAAVTPYSFNAQHAFSATKGDGDDGQEKGDRGNNNKNNNNVSVLEACRRFDFCVRVDSWRDWFPALLRRMPNLAHLDLFRFPERLVEVLCVNAPHLAVLRIEGHDQSPSSETALRADGIVTADDASFAWRLLVGLPRLRSLALPYATVLWRDLLAAADRLESLHVHLLSDACHMMRHTCERERLMDGIRMTHLTHLVTDIGRVDAVAILERLPAFCNGRIGFRSDNYAVAAPAWVDARSRLVAEISFAAVDGADGELGLHARWSAEEIARPTYDLAAGMGALMANLARPWVSQTFYASVPAATQRLLVAEMAHSRWIDLIRRNQRRRRSAVASALPE
jgi:hypothetical protein